MKLVRLIRSIMGRVDGIILRLLGERRNRQSKIDLQDAVGADEVRKKLVRAYIDSQPSLLQLVLRKIYVTVRHAIGIGARKVLRLYRRSRA